VLVRPPREEAPRDDEDDVRGDEPSLLALPREELRDEDRLEFLDLALTAMMSICVQSVCLKKEEDRFTD